MRAGPFWKRDGGESRLRRSLGDDAVDRLIALRNGYRHDPDVLTDREMERLRSVIYTHRDVVTERREALMEDE